MVACSQAKTSFIYKSAVSGPFELLDNIVPDTRDLSAMITLPTYEVSFVLTQGTLSRSGAL